MKTTLSLYNLSRITLFILCGWILSGNGLAAETTEQDVRTTGGQVLDPNNQPFVGFHVYINLKSTDIENPSPIISCVTNAEGKWVSDPIPSNAEIIYIEIQDSKNGPTQIVVSHDNIDEEKLRDHTLTIILATKIQGMVKNQQGQPVPDCTFKVYPYQSTRWVKTVTSNKDGRFEMKGLFAQKITFVAEKSTYAPAVVEVPIQSPMPDVQIQLLPGKTLRGYVVDPNGIPLQDVTVAAEQIQSGPPLTWKQTTDSKGQFRWDAAPQEQVFLNFSKSGYIRLDLSLSAAAEFEHEIILYPSFHVSGSVTDAQTNQPIPAFTIQKITLGSSGVRSFPEKGVSGIFNTVFDSILVQPDELHRTEQYRFQVEIQAEGYTPAKSDVWPIGTKNQTVRVALNKANKRLGFVYTPQGLPAAGATLFIVKPKQHFTLKTDSSFESRRFHPDSSGIITSSDGCYEIPNPDNDSEIIARHDSGFVQVMCKDLPQNGIFQLQPWSRIEGVAYSKGKPAANEQVILASTDEYKHFMKTTTCDVEGRFTFENIPPVDISIGKTSKIGTTSTMVSSLNLKPLPGQTENIVLGVGGQTITGHILLPKDPDFPKNWIKNYYAIISQHTNITQSQPYPNSEIRRFCYHVPIQSDGRFQINNIPPGEYYFDATFHTLHNSSVFANATTLWGSIRVAFKVTDTQSAEKPIDLGALEIQKVLYPPIGQSAPDFTVQCIDGSEFQLSGQKGIFVLIHFWSIGSDNQISQMLIFRDVISVYAENPKFKAIGLSTMPQLKEGLTSEKFLLDNKIFWPQAIMPQSKQNHTYAIAAQYGSLNGLNGWFLIGSDQKIIASSPNGDNLAEKVSEVLLNK